MRILYLDLVGGASGDMLLGALLDAGASPDEVRRAWAAVGLTEVELSLSEVRPAGLRARRAEVLVRGRLADEPHALPAPGVPGGAGTSDPRALDSVHGAAHPSPPPPEPDEQPQVHHPHAHAHAHPHPHPHAHPRPGAEDPGLAAHQPHHLSGHRAMHLDPGAINRAAGVHLGGPAMAVHVPPTALDPAPASSAERHDYHHHHQHRGHHAHHGHRPYALIRDLISRAVTLSPRTRALALDAFRRLGEAEAHVHGVPLETVEFHEVGSDDAIADIVGVAAAVTALEAAEIVVSPVPLGRGLIGGAHGPIPLPGPATLEILRGAPVEGTSLAGETVTPTGAALLTALATRFGPAPAMVIAAVGVGAGRRVWPDRPNVVRALLGESVGAVITTRGDCVVEANIDDMSPEHLGHLRRALFAAGALDVWWTPISMKKDRMGVLVSALIARNLAEVAASTFLVHSTTLGVRVAEVARIRGPRRVGEVQTRFGAVRVKIADRPNGPPLITPEYDDCERLADAFGVSLREVTEAALQAAWLRSPAH